MSAPVDVVVPVYKGLEHTRRCLESVLDSTRQRPVHLVVVDDCTPEPAISGYLDTLAAAGRITLLRNEQNAGFVESVNRGMRLHPDRDVVLLNSDAEVANDWIDRLHAAAYSRPDVATVTPFSNNATICSYPYEGWTGGVPGGLGLAGLDRLFAQTHRGRTLELPTAVGFCMFIRRAAIEAFGLFDAARYGRGYGEENDFSRRAHKAGWSNLLACDVFVFHEGSVSFSHERLERVEAATRALLEVHPEYSEKVHDFIVSDPVEPLRRAIDVARAATGSPEARHVVEERADERAALLRRLHEALERAADRGAHANEVHQALERVTALANERERGLQAAETERQRILSELGAEIAHLRSRLAQAETLVSSQQAELVRIRSFWLWRLYQLLLPARQAPQPLAGPTDR